MAVDDQNFSISELIAALLRDQKIHTGWWGLTMHFNANGTSVVTAEAPSNRLPGLAISVAGVTLVPAQDGEEGSVDASAVNPGKPARGRRAGSSKALH